MPSNPLDEQTLPPNDPTLQEKRQAKMPEPGELPHSEIVNQQLTHKTPTGYQPEGNVDIVDGSGSSRGEGWDTGYAQDGDPYGIQAEYVSESANQNADVDEAAE